MEKKSVMKKITGSREALLASCPDRSFCNHHSNQPIIPDS